MLLWPLRLSKWWQNPEHVLHVWCYILFFFMKRMWQDPVFILMHNGTAFGRACLTVKRTHWICRLRWWSGSVQGLFYSSPLSCSSVQVTALGDGGLQHPAWLLSQQGCGRVLLPSRQASAQARVCRHGPSTSQQQLQRRRASSQRSHHGPRRHSEVDNASWEWKEVMSRIGALCIRRLT